MMRSIRHLSVVAAAKQIVHVEPDCDDCKQRIQAAIDECISKGTADDSCEVQLAPGTFALESPNFLTIQGATSLSLRGAGASTRLLLSGDVLQMGVFKVEDSANVALGGFSIEMARVSYTLCTAQSADDGAVLCSYDADKYIFNESWQYVAQHLLEYDPSSRHTTGLECSVDDVAISIQEPGLMRIDSIPMQISVGKQYVVRHMVYGGSAFLVEGSTDFSLDSVAVYSHPGMAFIGHGNKNVLINGMRVERKGDAPMSISADGVHISGSRGGYVQLENCVFDGQGDDGLNINSEYQGVSDISTDRKTLKLSDRFDKPAAPRFQPGDTFEVRDRYTFAVIARGSAAAVTPTSLQLDQPLPAAVSQWDLVQNTALQADWVLLKASNFTRNRARGALLKASNVLAENNVFEAPSGPCIQAIPDGCKWFEGNAFTNWTLQSNIFRGCNFGAGQREADIMVAAQVPATHSNPPSCDDSAPFSEGSAFLNVVLKDNIWEMSDNEKSAFGGFGVVGLSVSGNRISTPKSGGAATFKCHGCQQMDFEQNTCDGDCTTDFGDASIII